MSHRELEEIEVSREDAMKKVKDRDDMIALTKNRIFKRLITEGYGEEFALSSLRLSTAVQASPEIREQCMIDMHGPSTLTRYIQGVINQGNQAENAIEQYDQEIARLQDEMAGVVDAAFEDADEDEEDFD